MGNLFGGGAPAQQDNSAPPPGFLDRLAGGDTIDPAQLEMAKSLGLDPSQLQRADRRKALMALAAGLGSGEPLAAGLTKGIVGAQSIASDSLLAASKNAMTQQELKRKKYGLDALDTLHTVFNDPNATPEQRNAAVLRAAALSGEYGPAAAFAQVAGKTGKSGGPKTTDEALIQQATDPITGKVDVEKLTQLKAQLAKATHVGSGNDSLVGALTALGIPDILANRTPYANNQAKVLTETDQKVRDQMNTEADTYDKMYSNASAIASLKATTPPATSAGLDARSALNAALPQASDPNSFAGRAREAITQSGDIPGQRMMQQFATENQVFYQTLLKGPSSDRDMQVVANAGAKISDPLKAATVSARVAQLLRDRQLEMLQTLDPANLDPQAVGSMGRLKAEYIKEHPILPTLQAEFPDVFGTPGKGKPSGAAQPAAQPSNPQGLTPAQIEAAKRQGVIF